MYFLGFPIQYLTINVEILRNYIVQISILLLIYGYSK